MEIRPTPRSEVKEQDPKPNVIKGFWSSASSSEREIEPPVMQEKPVELKYDFYNSGIQFYNNEAKTPEKVQKEMNDEWMDILKTT